MNDTIFKFLIDRCHMSVGINMPIGAVIISFGMDPSKNLCIWAGVDTQVSKEERRFLVVYTGEQIPSGDYVPIGTHVSNGIVYHCLEIIS